VIDAKKKKRDILDRMNEVKDQIEELEFEKTDLLSKMHKDY